MSLIDHAKAELAAINFGKEDTAVMLELLAKFTDQWDSGGAVHAVAPVFVRLLSYQPLSPLTGADDEWVEHDYGTPPYYQNIRCSSVFKDSKDGPAYDIKGQRKVLVTFPYDPATAMPDEPVIEVPSAENESGPGPSVG